MQGTPDAVADAQIALGLVASARELASNVRALVADEIDLLSAEAHVAMQSILGCVIVAVSAAVFAVLATSALLGVVAVMLVDNGMSLPRALGVVALTCLALCGFLMLALKGLLSRKLFGGVRRQLRGQP